MRTERDMRFSPDELARRLGLPPPTEEQRAVISADPSASHVIVAGAGSGKTETMSARVVWLVANGFVLPEEILGLTFTRKAAGELSERVIRRLRGLRAIGLLAEDDLVASPTIATYHSYAASLVTDHGMRLGVEPGTRLLGEAAAWQLAHDLVESWDPQQISFTADDEIGRELGAEDLRSLDRAVDTIVQAVLSLAGQCAEHLVTPAEFAAEILRLETRLTGLPRTGAGGTPSEPLPSKNAGKSLASIRARRALVPVLRSYLRRKRELEVMDFGDQVVIAARLAELPEVAQGQRARYRVVLLDEFQDTSHAQLELLARLFGAGHPVTAVGDPNQSIYGWRGASAGNLTAFRTRFAGGRSRPVQVHGLTTSWRNPTSALAVANVLAAPLRDALQVEVAQLSARPDAVAGQVVVGWHETCLDEARWVAEGIAERWQPGSGTAAVICRQRSQFPAIETALRERGLPVEVVGLGGLLQRPEVADVVAVLQILSDPTRSDALIRLLSGPRWQLGPRDLMAFGAWARELGRPARDTPGDPSERPDEQDRQPGRPDDPGRAASPLRPRRPLTDPEGLESVSLIDALLQLPPPEWVGPSGYGISAPARGRLQRLAGELARLRRRTTLPLVDLVMEIERALLLEVELSVASLQSTGNPVARGQLDEFLDVAANFSDAAGRPSLPAFVAWLAAAAERERGLEQASDDREQERPRDGIAEHVDPSTAVVQVLTVHAAKGLEWDVVAVPGMLEGRFPAGRTKDGQDTASGWPTTMADIPFDLRGDADSLPRWDLDTARNHAEVEEALLQFRFDYGAHEALEERRLAYVAVTRTTSQLLLSGFVWDLDRSRPREHSRFLREVLEAAQQARAARAGEGLLRLPGTPDLNELADIDSSALAAMDEPAAKDNPLQALQSRIEWPLPSRLEPQLRAAADLVLAADHEPAAAAAAQEPPSPAVRALRELGTEIDRLLEERALARRPIDTVRLPGSLSASNAVKLAADPAGFAVDLRRPMPVEPRAATRRGTTFHEWIERRLHSQALLDLADLPGAGDLEVAGDEELERLKVAFESSQWARREVLDTEVDLETVVDGVVLRGRIDAIFAAPASAAPVRFDLVDWKTGPRPSGARARAATVQLAVYRVALARLRGLPLEAVRASFFYLSTGETITPTTGLTERALVEVIRGGLRQ